MGKIRFGNGQLSNKLSACQRSAVSTQRSAFSCQPSAVRCQHLGGKIAWVWSSGATALAVFVWWQLLI